MALDQQEQRLRSELRRKNSALQNAISNAAVKKKIAESPDESPEKRAKAREEYNKLQGEVAKLRSEVKDLEESVSKEQSRKESIEVKQNYDRLKGQYDLLLDKTSPEAKKLADRVNIEVNKLNDAYKKSGSSTVVFPITEQAVTSATQSATEKGRATTRATKTTATVGITGGTTGRTAGDATDGATGGATGGAGAGKGKGKGTPEVTKTPEQRYSDAIAMAVEKYNMPDVIFKNIPSLGELLKRYVDNKLTDQQFRLELQNDPWYRSNSSEIKARYVQLYNYEDLVKKGLATGTTDYEQKLNGIVRNIQAKARAMNGIEIPDDQAKLMAKDLYIYNLDSDPAVLTERLARFIRPSGGMIAGQPTIGYGGEALKNYQNLQALAKANGFKIEDVLPRDAMGAPMTAEGTLEQLATGKLDINRIAQDIRKLAAVGQSDYVKDLLGQGYNLDAIYSPYRQRMAAVLEVDPNTISLTDPALRMGISKEGDLNLYDYEKALRKDARWQYTQNARNEVSTAAFQVLRDFGFQG